MTREQAANEGDRRFLWGYCYRLTGSAADADDLVQDTLLRALERPPARPDEPMRPWLVRVATNLGRDLLRRRKRRGYVGPWLPAPIEDDEIEVAVEPLGADGRYDLVESVSFAFLLALEALTPKQRAVLLLCDVFDYSVREAAAALGLSEANVKTTHHRARRALEGYEQSRPAIDKRELQARTRRALLGFLDCISTSDGAAAEAILSEQCRALSDGGGEFFAARVPVIGRDRVLKLYIGLAKHQAPNPRFSLRTLNGAPVLVMSQVATGKYAPLVVLSCDLGADGKIANVYSVLATNKLVHVRSKEHAEVQRQLQR